MAIIENKKIYDDSKSELPKLKKDLETINKEIVTLTKSSNELAKALALVKKSNDGTEARKLADGTDKLTKSTKKLKVELTAQERVEKQIIAANKKLADSHTKQAKDLALLKQRTLQQNKALREQAKATLGVKNSMTRLGKELLGAAGITAGLTTVVAAGKAFVKTAGELITITKQAEKTFGLTGNSAKVFAADVLSLAETFDKDYNQVLEAANVVSKELGISATAALAHIQEGFEKGSNNTDEFLDILKEYPAQFRAAGIDAQTMFAIINQQVEQGIYSDKGVDAIKEGGLRLRENTKAVQEALIPLDESIKLQIEQEIAAGNSFKAIQLVSGALNDTSLTAEETQAIIADVFGGAGEDAGLRYLQTLQNIETSLDNVATQATESEQATLTLSKTWNRFVVGVADEDSIFSKFWANFKLVIAGLINEVTKFFNLFKSDESIKKTAEETAKLNAELDKNTDANKENEESADELEKSKQRLIAANGDLVDGNGKIIKTSKQLIKEYDNLIAKEKELNAFRSRDTQKAPILPSLGATGVSGGGVTSPAELNQMLIDQKAAQDDKAREDELQKIQDWEDAKLAIQEQALNSGVQLANDIFSNFQDERLAELNSQAEAEKAILQDKLDKGVISEEEFTKKIADIEKKQRIESAKADKKKAVFDIAIRTAIAIISALTSIPPNIPLSIAVGVVGATQAAAVALRPIPKFAEGEVNIGGRSHAKGGIHAEIEGGESVINKGATSQSEGLLNMINDGLITDKNVSSLSSQNNNMFLGGLLMQGNKHSKDLITLMSNMGWTYDRDGIRTINKADGSLIEKFNING